MPEWFEQSEFSSEEGDLSPSEHFESMHSPLLGYTEIQKSLGSLDAGLEEFEDERRTNAEIYANITLFREVMQYIEEFGIYFYSRLDPDVEFVDAITGTTPRQVKQIFESIRDGYIDSVVGEYQDEATADAWLSSQLGYDILQQLDIDLSDEHLLDEGTEVVVDDLDEAIDVSIETVRTRLQDIAEYFLQFEEPYNAIKHGNRVYPRPDFDIGVEGPDGQVELDLQDKYVSFLCKTTGDRRGGERYTFTAPVRVLREQAIPIARMTKNIYVPMYELKQDIDRSHRTGEEVTLNANFYGIAADSNDGIEFSLTSMENADSTVWIPEETLPQELEEYELPDQTEVAIGLHKRGNEMVVITEGDSKPSYDYPILAEAEMASSTQNLLGMEMTQNFSFKLYQLPLWQYLELKSLKEFEPTESITLENGITGESRTLSTTHPVSLPSLPDPEFPEELEFMRNVRRAADKPIWTPVFWPERVLPVVEFYHQNFDLTRDIANELLNAIEELTDETVATIPTFGILTSDQRDDEDVYEVKEEEELPMEMCGIILEVDDERESGEFSLVPGEDPRYERGEVGETDSIGVLFVEDDPMTVYHSFQEHGLQAISQLSLTKFPEDADAILETKRHYGPKFTWYYLDKFHFVLYREAPHHLEDQIQ